MSHLSVVIIVLLCITILACFITIIYFLEKIQKITLKTTILVGIIIVLSYAMLVSGIKLGQRSAKAQIINLYSRPLIEITSYLYDLSSEGQYTTLHETLTIIHNELPKVMTDDQYTLTDMTLQIFPKEERVNGHIIERPSTE